MEERIDFIDSVLSTLEDIIKGQNGDNITTARGELMELTKDIEKEKHSYAASLLEWTAREGFVLINTTEKVLWCRKAESISYNSSEIIQAFNEHEQSKIEKK